VFDKNNCTITTSTDKSIFFIENRKGNVYKIYFSNLADQKVVSLLPVLMKNSFGINV
jgi:hypothetical protein